MSDLGAPYRPVPALNHANGQPVKTSLRRITAESGSAFVTAATAALSVEAAGLLYVSYAAQYAYVLREKPGQQAASVIEALMLDSGMVILSVLALGLAKKGLSSRAERTLIMVCAAMSAAMNYAASDSASWRSVAAYVIAPVFLAVVTDRVIAAVRRHVLGPAESSAWATLGRALAGAARAAVMVVLYMLRFLVDRRGTCRGLRALILAAAPLPDTGQHRDATRSVAADPGGAGTTTAAPVPGQGSVPGLASAPVSPPPPAGPALNGHARPGPAAGSHTIPPGQRTAGRPGPARRGAAPVTDDTIEAHYASDVDAGRVPSGKAIRREWHVGNVRADQIHIRLTARYLANMPAGVIPAAVAALPADDIGKVRDLLSSAHGAAFGPNADIACQACASQVLRLPGHQDQPLTAGTPGTLP